MAGLQQNHEPGSSSGERAGRCAGWLAGRSGTVPHTLSQYRAPRSTLVARYRNSPALPRCPDPVPPTTRAIPASAICFGQSTTVPRDLAIQGRGQY
eukprot:1628021-Rhodomonas_salina.2